MSLDKCKVKSVEIQENDSIENTVCIKQEPEAADKVINFEFIGVDCANPDGLDTEEHSTGNKPEASPYPPTVEEQIPTYIIQTAAPKLANNVTFIPKKYFTCFKCGYATDITLEFKRHIFVHRKETSFRCSVCHLTFKWMVDFRNHTSSHESLDDNTSDQVFGCLYCQFKSKRKSEVAEHSLLGHPDEISLKCDICHLHIKSKPEFEMHVRTHHKYTCKHCDMTFLKKVNYQLHVKLHAKKRKIGHRDDLHDGVEKQQINDSGETNMDNGVHFVGENFKVEVEDTTVSNSYT